VAPAKLLNISAFELAKVLEMDPEFLGEGEHEHDQAVGSISWRMEADMNINLLTTWIRELIKTKGADLYRYKGVLAVKGMRKKFVFQGVHMLFKGHFTDAMSDEHEKRENFFIFIGKNLDKQDLAVVSWPVGSPTNRSALRWVISSNHSLEEFGGTG